MKFLIIKKQDGEGCDYTIGCGMTADIVEADSLQQAIDDYINETIAEQREYDGTIYYNPFKNDDRSLEWVRICDMSNVIDIDIDSISDKINEEIHKCEQSDKEDKERKVFERLQKKFGGEQSGN